VLEQLRGYQAADAAGKEKITGALKWCAFEIWRTCISVAVIMGIFMYFMRQTIIVMSRLIEYDMRKEIYDQYQALDKGFYRRNSTGDMMSASRKMSIKSGCILGPAYCMVSISSRFYHGHL
jgi:ATP-binding cassette subfamily B protein